jgi:hypothetical protein
VVPIFKDQEQKAQDTGIKFVQEVYPVLRQFLPS